MNTPASFFRTLRIAVRHNRPVFGFTLALLAIAFAGSIPLWKAKGDRSVILTLISPHGDGIRQELSAAFVQWHVERYGPAPQLQWLDLGGTSEALRYLEARYRKTPASAGVDILFGGGTTPFQTLASQSRLVPNALAAKYLNGLPATLGGLPLHRPDQGWYGTALAGFGIIWNKPLLAGSGISEPASYSDLGAPLAFDKIALVDPRGSGSAHVIYEIILQKYGWEKGFNLLCRIGANARAFTRGSSGILPLIASGEVIMGLTIDQSAWSLQESYGTNRIGFTLPVGESVITPDPIGILKGAPEGEAARRFLEFTLSVPAQRLWALKKGNAQGPIKQSLNRMPILPEAYAGLSAANSYVASNPFSDTSAFTGFSYSDSLTTVRWVLLNDLLGLYLIDAHEASHRAWKALMETESSETQHPETASLALASFRPPSDWGKISELLPRWSDPVSRNSTVSEWTRGLARTSKP